MARVAAVDAQAVAKDAQKKAEDRADAAEQSAIVAEVAERVARERLADALEDLAEAEGDAAAAERAAQQAQRERERLQNQLGESQQANVSARAGVLVTALDIDDMVHEVVVEYPRGESLTAEPSGREYSSGGAPPSISGYRRLQL